MSRDDEDDAPEKAADALKEMNARRISRRAMVRAFLLGGLGALGAWHMSRPGELPLDVVRRATPDLPSCKVTAEGVQDWTSQEELIAALRTGLDGIGGVRSIVPNGSTVFIKPNLVRHDNQFDPRVVPALVQLIEEAGAERVLVGDNAPAPTRYTADSIGLLRHLRQTDAEFVEVERGKFSMVDIPNGVAVKKAPMSNYMLDTDVLVNVAFFKKHPHYKVNYSLALKNLMGLVRFQDIVHLVHPVLEDGIRDLVSTVTPQLNIVDMLGTPAKTVVMGTHPVAVDRVAMDLYGEKDMPLYLQRAFARFSEVLAGCDGQ